MSNYAERFEEIMSQQEQPSWDEIRTKGRQAEYINNRIEKVIFGYNYNGRFYFKRPDGKVDSMMGSAKVVESVITESRPVRIIDMVTSLSKADFIDELVSLKSTASGAVALFRTKDGNAYEVAIKPAEYSDNFPELTKKDK